MKKVLLFMVRSTGLINGEMKEKTLVVKKKKIKYLPYQPFFSVKDEYSFRPLFMCRDICEGYDLEVRMTSGRILPCHNFEVSLYQHEEYML